MKAYIPVSIYNFNALFETESISPKSYYKQRNFGNHSFRDTPIDQLHQTDHLLLYKEIPHANDNDVMFLCVDFGVLEIDLVKEVAEDIFSYPKTIYFNPQYLDVLFLNEKQLQETVIYAQNFTTLKVSRYQSTFKILNLTNFKKYNLQVQNTLNKSVEQVIENDNFFNHFKGLIYGFAIGSLSNNKPTAEKELLKLFQDVLGSFTTIKSQLLIKESQKDSFVSKKPYEKPNKYYQSPNIDNSDTSKKALLNLIHTAEKLFYQTFPQELENQRNNLVMLKNEVERFADVMRTQKAHRFQLENFEEIGKFLLLNPFEKAIALFQEYANLPKLQISLNSDFAERKTEDFKTVFADLKRQTETLIAYQFSNTKPKGLDFQSYVAVSPKGNVQIQPNQFGLSEQENNFLEIILSVLFNDEMKRANPTELTTAEKTKIIDKIGFLVNEKGLRDFFRDDLVGLRSYFISFGSFQIENLKSEVMKSFSCFLVKPDNLDELVKYLETKKVTQMQIGIGFWCAYNGFTSINENNTKLVWSSKIDFDTYLNGIYLNLQVEFKPLYSKKAEQLHEQPKTQTLVSKISDMGNALLGGIFSETKSETITYEQLKTNLEKLVIEYPQYSSFVRTAFDRILKTDSIDEQKRTFENNLKGNKESGISFDKKTKATLTKKLFQT